MNLSNKFDKLSIRHKISLPVIASALVFFLFIFAFITIIERSAMFKKIEYDVGIMAEMAASNSVTALVFDDRKTGEEILSSFSKLPGVVSAVLYNQKGHVFAQYPKTGLDATGLAKVPFKEGFHYGKGRLTVSRNIYFNDRLIGNVFITTTLQDVDRILKDYIIYSAVILSSGFLGVLLISALLQRLLVRPIMHLRNTIDSVSTGNDYSIRSEKAADDEIGYLVDGFNNMLSQVQRRDAELNKYRHQLEKLVEKRTEQLKAAHEALSHEMVEKARFEEEKKRLLEKEKMLKDIHDGIGGIATNIRLLADIAQEKLSVEDLKGLLATISELSKEELFEIRNILYGLDEKQLNWHTLAADLRRYGNTLMEPHGISFEMHISIDEGQIKPPSHFCLGLFRIYKEAVTNITKHSRAGSVKVDFGIHEGTLTLTIGDDGIGLTGESGRGRGVFHMKMRAEEMGGRLTVTSEKGTRVHLEVPIP